MQLVKQYRHSRRDFLRDGRLSLTTYIKNDIKLVEPKPTIKKVSLKKYGDELRQRLSPVEAINQSRKSSQVLASNQTDLVSNNSLELLSKLSAELETVIYPEPDVNFRDDSEEMEDELSTIEVSNIAYSNKIEYLEENFQAKPAEDIYVEITADGGRLEFFETGGYIYKDILGKVVEVCSRAGDRLNLRYNQSGNLKSFARTNAEGVLHSCGDSDKHGVIVRDCEGRAKARGESITVDTLGRLFVHDIAGQYFSVDLLSGLFSERRLVDSRIQGIYGGKYITAVFANDGFRIATFFVKQIHSNAVCNALNMAGVATARKNNIITSLRFYGRDGSLVEFLSIDDAREMKPQRVLAANSVAVKPEFQTKKTSWTCWHSLNEYLLGIG